MTDPSPLIGDSDGNTTPLADEETEGLIPDWVATRADLNIVEQPLRRSVRM
jgi:hypothetical protein